MIRGTYTQRVSKSEVRRGERELERQKKEHEQARIEQQKQAEKERKEQIKIGNAAVDTEKSSQDAKKKNIVNYGGIFFEKEDIAKKGVYKSFDGDGDAMWHVQFKNGQKIEFYSVARHAFSRGVSMFIDADEIINENNEKVAKIEAHNVNSVKFFGKEKAKDVFVLRNSHYNYINGYGGGDKTIFHNTEDKTDNGVSMYRGDELELNRYNLGGNLRETEHYVHDKGYGIFFKDGAEYVRYKNIVKRNNENLEKKIAERKVYEQQLQEELNRIRESNPHNK